MKNTESIYLVTWVTHNSRVSDRMVTFLPPEFIKGLKPLVLSLADQKFMVEAIGDCIIKYDIKCLVFNVLPDHVHMVLFSKDEDGLADMVRKIKGYTSHLFRKKRTFENRVWARKFNRVFIEDDGHLANVINYAKLNHIKHEKSWGRANLVGFTDVLSTTIDEVCVKL